MSQPPVLIVGAGPTGLVLALWLTRLGISVRIIDKAAGPADFSRALGVQARTLEFYQQYGFADEVVAQGVKAKGVNLWVRGARAARLPFGDLGEGLSPFPFILDFAQDAHERLLIEKLEAFGVTVERRTELLRVESRADGVRAVLRRPDGTEEICESSYLAGCDGAHSAARETLGIGFPGATYTRLFYVADVEVDGLEIDDELHIDLDEADLLALFPMKGKNHVRLVGTVREEPGRNADTLTFADVSQRVISQMKLAIKSVRWFSPYRVHHRVASRFREGRVFLLGDAAHIHSPVGAQGMNTGIGDAVNLAWKLAGVLSGRAASSVLDSYEPERIAFAKRLVATTDRIFTFVSKEGPIANRVRTVLFPRVAPWLLRRPFVRRFIFRTASQIGVNYRIGPLSSGRAGAVHSGDRLPWIPIPATEDNFAPLASLAWQVHVYGEAKPAIVAACRELNLPLHVFEWREPMRTAGISRNALYLVRPDGYVGLADRSADPKGLSAYCAEHGFRFSKSGG